MRKTISYNEYLKIVALFHMAHTHAVECLKFEKELCTLLKADDQYAGCISDQIFEPHPDLDVALENENVKVRPKLKKHQRKKTR